MFLLYNFRWWCYNFIIAGHFYINSTAHSTHTLRALNFDIEKGEIIKLESVVTDYEQLSNLILKQIEETSEDIHAFIVKAFPDGLEDRLKEIDLENSLYSDSFNIDEKGITLNFEVPYSMGGYVSIFIAFHDLK